jgi:hypothetical protein
MNDNNYNFEELRRLLALKRHEIPPPGYFENFSGNVIACIRAGEAVRELPWFLKFLQLFESRPAYPVAAASSLCTLLLFGIITVERQPEIVSAFPTMNNGSYPFAATTSPGSIDSGSFAIASTNPPTDFSPNPSLFQPNSYYQPAGFSQGGN